MFKDYGKKGLIERLPCLFKIMFTHRVKREM